MSATRFIRRFKAATGMTPGSYRLNLRRNGARRLLASGTALSEAAHAMGFADQAHMQRAFKAHHALTPGNYAGMPAALKTFDALLMLLGRLEIFGLIQLFFIKWWR